MTTIFDVEPGPQVAFIRLATDNIAAEYATFTRTQNGKTSILRGGYRIPLALYGSERLAVARDHEVLFEIPILYQAGLLDINYNVIETVTAPEITIAGNSAWLRDVLVPSLSTPIRLIGMEAGDGSNEARRALLRPLGRKNPVVVSDVRSGYSGSTSALTLTATEQRSLESLFSSGHVLMWTGPASWGIELPRYVVIGDVEVKRQSAALEEARIFNFDWTEVDAPDLTLFTPIFPQSWQQLLDKNTFWFDIVLTEWWDVIFPTTVTRLAWSA